MIILRKQFAVQDQPTKTQQKTINKTQGMIKEIKPMGMPEFMKRDLPNPDEDGRNFMSSASNELDKLSI